jgi:hypothetical protein
MTVATNGLCTIASMPRRFRVLIAFRTSALIFRRASWSAAAEPSWAAAVAAARRTEHAATLRVGLILGASVMERTGGERPLAAQGPRKSAGAAKASASPAATSRRVVAVREHRRRADHDEPRHVHAAEPRCRGLDHGEEDRRRVDDMEGGDGVERAVDPIEAE